MSSMGPEADDETNADEESPAGRADMPAADGEESSAAVGEDELAADGEDELTAAEDEPASPGAGASPTPTPTRPLPRRVPAQSPNRMAPAESPPADHTVRHLLDILKRLP